jgi:hypothetical protein
MTFQAVTSALPRLCCWVVAFEVGCVAKVIEMSDMMRRIAIQPVGYSAERPIRPARRLLQYLAHRERAS